MSAIPAATAAAAAVAARSIADSASDASTAAAASAAAAQGLQNPFAMMVQGVSETQSIAFACVYAVFLVAYAGRLWYRPKHWMAYLFLTLFAVFRVPTFVLRVFVARTSPDASNFQALLIASGVFLVMGFLFLAEAVCQTFFDWWCTVRGRETARFTPIVHPVLHVAMVVISVIGVVGAVLQIFAVNKLDMDMFEVARKLRQASGALFLIISGSILIGAIALVFAPGPERVHKLVPTAVFVVCGIGLGMESAYRVWAATLSTGWIVSTHAIDILLVLPELLILTIYWVLDFDDYKNVVLVCTRTPELPVFEPVTNLEKEWYSPKHTNQFVA